MKMASKNLSVYNCAGDCLIGSLLCGDAVHEIGKNSSGVLIAYIIGLIKETDEKALVCPEQWKSAAEQKQKFLCYIAEQEEALYVWGAQGQQMTPSLIKKLESTDANYKRALAHYKKHLETGQPLTAYDCSGLVVQFLLAEGLVSGDRSANGLYHNECDEIGKEQLTAGDLVFKKYLTKNQMYHVGVYMGDGTVVHAKGRDDGVVREPFGTAGWNRFGRLKCWGGAQNTVSFHRLLKNGGKPYLRGDDVRAVQCVLENRGYSTGSIDGIYGPLTEKAVRVFQQAVGLNVDGIVGLKTWAALIG